MGKLVFTGIRPTGRMHLGNLVGMFGSLRPDHTYLLMIADLHGLVSGVVYEEEVYRKVAELRASFKAMGITDYYIFRQSENQDHLAGMWYLNGLVNVSHLLTMVGFKSAEKRTVGLLSYPVLMAADIMIYNPDLVPVGDDQRQHVELYNMVTRRLSSLLVHDLKEVKFEGEVGARIMDLQDPEIKMSKSNANTKGIIYLEDTPESISLKVKKAVTSSVELKVDSGAGTGNLLTLARFCLGSARYDQELADVLTKDHSNMKV